MADSRVVSSFEVNCDGVVVKEHQVGANPTPARQLEDVIKNPPPFGNLGLILPFLVVSIGPGSGNKVLQMTDPLLWDVLKSYFL